MYCDSSYRTLFQNLVESDFENEYQMIQYISVQLANIASELFIGRFILDKKTAMYVSEEGYEEKGSIEYVFQKGDETTTTMNIWPEKGYVWSKVQESNIRLLAETIHIFVTRAKLIDKVSKAQILDKMTGLPNVSAMHIHVTRLITQNRMCELTCFFINLKNFRFINNKATFKGGDNVMRQFSKKLVEIASKENEFAGRLGGDNFILLIQHSHVGAVMKELSNIHTKIMLNGNEADIPIEVRAGVAPFAPEDGVSEVINKSSIALNYAKKSGQPFVIFEPYMLDMTLRFKQVSSCFSEALKNREFVVYYQPKILVSDQNICGSEALVRWIRDGKIISPMEFIPVLEQEGTICQLDFYVFEEVCTQIRNWIDSGIEPVRVSVNFSKQHLQNSDLLEKVVKIIEKYKIPPSYIEIELTELSDYQDYKVMEHFVNQIKKVGVATAIDDFGTGYSSMTLLRDLNVDTVKLDRSFVVNLEKKQSKDRVMIETVAKMVKAFGMDVLVEGVETREQFEFLKTLGCDVIQGYLFDKPMPEKEFTNKLKTKRCYS